MNEDFERQSSKAQATLLLNLSNDRRKKAEQLAKHEFRVLMCDLESGDFIFAPGGHVRVKPPEAWPVDPALRAASYSGLQTLNVPLGKIADSGRATQLPCIGIMISDEQPDVLKRSLISFFGEHHRNPFCRPLFLCQRFDLLPFFRRFGFAAYSQSTGWSSQDYKLLKLRHNMAQVRSVASGSVLW